MRIKFACLFALMIQNVYSASPSEESNRKDVIAAFHEKYAKSDPVAELEAIKDPTQKFLRIAAVMMELDSMQRALGECAWNFIFINSAGIPQPGGLKAEDISDPVERKRFVEEQGNHRRNLECGNEIGALRNKLSDMLSIIAIREHSNEELRIAYLRLQVALEESKGSFLDSIKARKSLK